jgi:hypothetical protein
VVCLRVFFFARLCVFFGGVVFAAEPAVVFEAAVFEVVFEPAAVVFETAVFDAAVFDAAVFDASVFDAAVFEPAADAAAFDAAAAAVDVDAAGLAIDAEPADAAALDAPGARDVDPDAFDDPLDEPEPALFVVVDPPAKPSASRYVPAPASARSTNSTATMRPMRRFGGGLGMDPSVIRGRRCCDVGFMLCAGADVAPFLDCAGAGVGIGCAACGLLGARCTLGVSGYDAGGAWRGS